jgi:hypothetical protein
MRTLWQDLRYGARMLLKNPGFTTIALITLALGIGANTAIFSLIDAVLLKTLPVKDPEQLVALTSVTGAEERRPSFSYPTFHDLRERNQVFAEIFAYDGLALNLSKGDRTDRVSGQLVSGNFFSGLGAAPLLGRVFSSEDDKTPGAHAVAILGHDFWRRKFASDPNVVGKTIRLNGYPFTVVGIAAPGFFGVEAPASPEVWVPIETLARSFWSNEIPIGKRIGVGSRTPDCEIIGVIKDTKYRTLKEQIPRTVYMPFAQVEARTAERVLHVRTAGEPKDLIAAIRHEARSLDKDLPLYDVRTFTELTADSHREYELHSRRRHAARVQLSQRC